MDLSKILLEGVRASHIVQLMANREPMEKQNTLFISIPEARYNRNDIHFDFTVTWTRCVTFPE